MADEIIRYVLEAVDNASSKLSSVASSLRNTGSALSEITPMFGDTSDALSDIAPMFDDTSEASFNFGDALKGLTTQIKTFGPVIGALIAAGTGAYMAFVNEEDAIVRAARATTKAAGDFDTAKNAISDLNAKLEQQGIATEDTTQAVTLLATKVGLDFNDAIARAADLVAFAKERNLELSGAVRILLRDTEDQKQAVQDAKNALRDNTKEIEDNERAMKSLDDQITDYTDKIKDLKAELDPTTNETRRMRDLTLDLSRTEADAAKDKQRLLEEYAKAMAKYGSGSEQAIAASRRLADQEESSGERIADIKMRISDLNEDIATRQGEVKDQISEFEQKLIDTSAAAEELKKKSAELTKEQDTLQESLTKANDATKANLELIDGAAERYEATKDSADKLRTTHEKMGNMIEDIGKKLGGVADLIMGFFDQVAVGYEVLTTIMDVWGWYFDRGVDNIMQSVKLIVETFTDMFTKIGKGYDDLIKGAQKFIKDLGDEFGKLIEKGLQWGSDLVANVIKGITDKAKEIADAIAKAGGDFWRSLTGGSTGLVARGVTPLQEGGIISSPTLAVLGEGGENEYIIPESKMRSWMGRGDTTITIHVHASNDPIRTADEVGRRVLSVLGASNSSSIPGVFM